MRASKGSMNAQITVPVAPQTPHFDPCALIAQVQAELAAEDAQPRRDRGWGALAAQMAGPAHEAAHTAQPAVRAPRTWAELAAFLPRA